MGRLHAEGAALSRAFPGPADGRPRNVATLAPHQVVTSLADLAVLVSTSDLV